MSVQGIEQWIRAAKPKVTPREVDIQAGVHFEEVAEMLTTMDGADTQTQIMIDDARNACIKLATALKTGSGSFTVNDRKEMLDAICDQLVTATGVGTLLNMQVAEGLNRVNTSNWSKFVDGKPIYDANGKVAKGPNYKKCDLEGLY